VFNKRIKKIREKLIQNNMVQSKIVFPPLYGQSAIRMGNRVELRKDLATLLSENKRLKNDLLIKNNEKIKMVANNTIKNKMKSKLKNTNMPLLKLENEENRINDLINIPVLPKLTSSPLVAPISSPPITPIQKIVEEVKKEEVENKTLLYVGAGLAAFLMFKG